MAAADLFSLAEALLQARASQQPVDAAPWVATVTTADQAYEVQHALADRLGWLEPGQTQYWKSGGASRDATLTHAMLPPEGIWRSPARTARQFAMRGIEAEIALRLAAPVDAARAASLNRHRAVDLVDAMAVSIEVVDSRWAQRLDSPPLLKLADLQSHGALVLGPWVDFDAARDWSAQVCHVRIADGPDQTFRGSHALNDPAFVLPALLRHATRGGRTVPAGSVITTGTWCGVLWAQPGDAVSARFDGVGEAHISFTD